MNKSTSRRYGVEVGSIKLTTAELDLIRDSARTYLLDSHGFDTAAAWTNAVLGYLVKTGVLSVNGATNALEVESVAETHNLTKGRPRGY